MKEISFSQRIKDAAPELTVIQIEAEVENMPTSDLLWNEILQACEALKSNYEIQDVNKRIGIRATRDAYKALGKEPNRYRPSAEALCRRIINGKGIYRLDTLIDAINLISIVTGYSIGGFDCDKVEGNQLVLDAGNHEESFNAIGRGSLNIENLPVYRDAVGGIGTPTSDEERTKLTPHTKRLLMLVNIYGEDMSVAETLEFVKDVLQRHAELSEFQYKILKAL